MARSSGVDPPRARVPRRRPRPAARHVLRRRADAGLPRACPLGRPGPPPARRADEPPRRGEPRVARARADGARRGGRARRPRPLVPRGGDDRRAGARRAEAVLLRRRLARLAAREGGARLRGGDAARPRERGHRAARALRRPVPLQEVEGEAGAGEAQPDRTARAGAARRGGGARVHDEAAPDARLRVPEARAHRPDRARGGRPRRRRRREAPARRCFGRPGAGGARRARGAQRIGQDDAPRDAPRASGSRTRGA